MIALRRVPVVLSLSLCTLVPTVASASFPAGVWALVEKVTLEPDAKNPTMIRIDGVFMVANVQPDFPQYPGYSVPTYGYMYYQCGEKDLLTCQMEWAELAAVPMSDNLCRGWGDSSLPDNGIVRQEEPQAFPDMYPISMGILIGFTPCDALKAWVAENPQGGETDGSTGGSSGGDSSGGFNSSGEEGTTTNASTTSGGPTTNSESTGGGTSSSDPSATAGESSPTSDGPPDTGGGGETANGGSSSGGSATGNAETGLAPNEDKGCACRASDDTRPLGALALLFGLLALGRRRQRDKRASAQASQS